MKHHLERNAAPLVHDKTVELLALLEPQPILDVTIKQSEQRKTIQEEGIETLLELIRRRHSLHLRFSSGKDSTSCVVLMIEAVRRAVAEGRAGRDCGFYCKKNSNQLIYLVNSTL